MSESVNTNTPLPVRDGWQPRVALLVAATFFMEFLDGTILSTAMPAIARDFAVAPADVYITMTAYLITMAMGIPVSSWLAERLGARRVFCSSIALFTLASLLCALSQDLTSLTLSRVLQGAGGAMMVPVGTLVVLRGTHKEDLLRATAYLAWPALLAPAVAPLIGGALTTYLSWHWIFLINIPLGLAAFLAALSLMSKEAGDQSRRLDWVGLLLTALGVGALILGLELAGAHPAGPMGSISVALGLASLAGAVWWLGRTSNPLFQLNVFASRTFRATSTGGFIYRLTISAVPFLLPLMFQDGFGWDPLHAGAMVAAVFAGNIAIKPATTPLIRKYGFKPVLVFASLASAATFALCAVIDANTPTPLIFSLLICSGAFRSIGFSAYASIQYAEILRAQLPSANVISFTLVQLAAGAGVTVGALFLRIFAAPEDFGADPAAPYCAAFLAIAALMLLSALDSLMLNRDAGTSVSRGRPSSPRQRSRRIRSGPQREA